MGEPIPQVPLVDLAQGDELTATVEGLVLDDRLDLLVVSLDPYAINIATGKRGFDPNKLIIGDLIWVYSLAPTVSFATSKTNPPCSVEEAQAVQSSTVWKVHRFALIYRTLYDTMGYVTNMTATRNPTMQLCMQGHRRLVYATKSRAADPEEFRTIQPNSLICAPFRPPQLQYMVFCCNYSSAEGAQRELMSHVADIPFFPPPPPVPFGIRKVSDDFQRMVENKIHGFDMFQTNPGAVLHFLETIYSVAGGTIAACIRESTDPVVHSTFWTTQDANRCPAIVNFRIPQGKKSGWSSGRLIQGAYGPHIFCGTILRIETEGEQVIVTAQLQVSDTVRWREHLRQSRWHGLVVGTALQAADDRATPTLAMLESSVLSTSVSRNSKGWQSMQAILAGGIQLLGENREDRSRITANFQGEEVQLNVDQVRAVNMFHKRFPIAVIDSAYGAGKTVCTAVMAKEAAEQDKQVLLSTVQNSALDVIAAKMMQLSSERVRPVRFVADRLAHDLERTCEIDLPHLLENFHLTHADQLSEEEVDKFEKFAAARAELRRFAFSGTDPLTMSAEHKSLLVLDYGVSKRIYKLIRIFMRCYKPNVFLATVSSALNLTMRKGLWRKASKQWDTILVDEASMVPEATIVTMLSRFGDACFTLIGDSKQLPPYVGVLQIPLAVSLSSQSALTIANEHESAPVCPVRIVYRPHIEMMRLNSQLFYEGSLLCGTRASKRSNLLDHVTMPNPVVPIAFVDVPSQSVQSITRSHSNETEARAVNALARFLITHDPRRVNVALSRAKDGLFIIGAVSALSQLPLWAQIREWCHVRRLITPLDFFDPNWAPAPRP
ncbi:hypothetical protein ANCCAN_27427 [Ancylostoma caninum]|uniref:DNA2/NAM7 helicase-like C-terminal domain-containing protein n=1 Tax=Ancylostoma caninum TaxID=29170 RepID=A0A368F7K1_ANCCA|nr:hypothetical protein ANCCAN_27427 [Ancylostoma caninum]